MILLFSLLFAFLFFILLFLGLTAVLRRRREMAERIQMYSGYRPSVVRKASPFEVLRSRLHEIFAEKAKRSGTSGRSRLDLMMVRAGLPLLGSEFLANSLRAGFSFLQTMEIISREMEPPMSSEFEKVMRDTSLGKSLDEALHAMDERVGSADFSLVVTAVLIQQQVGGNLATILDTIRETISERIRLRREIGTLTAQGRATGIILACIPVALALFFYTLAPSFIQPLITTTIGHIAIGAAIILEIVGFIVIYKIVDIKI